MEILVEVKGSEEGRVEDSAADKPSSESVPLKQVADPVVYKLVRVDFDGKLVPATDDELMEVENLWGLEDSEMFSVCDVVETVAHDLDKIDSCEKTLSKKNEGSLENKCSEADEEKADTPLKETSATSASNLNNRQVDLSGNTGQVSSHQDGSNKEGSVGLQPDFSLLKGDINLDKLTMRELQETFRATFGRETSVKDKLWLKRRIAMGLTNSCDISMTRFIIKDGKFVEGELCKNMDCEDSVAGEVCSLGHDVPVACQNGTEGIGDGAEVKNSVMDSGHGSDDVVEHTGAKRVRKPTKRYIEELSDKDTRDCGGKLMSAAKRSEHYKSSSRLPVRTAWGPHTGSIVTRPDSIGGSGVRVPYVSRIRRCRPRKSVIALTKFKTSEVAVTRKIAEKSIVVSNLLPGNLDEDKVVEGKSVPFKQLIASEEEKEKKEKKCLAGMSDISQDREPTDVDSKGRTSHDDAAGNNSEDKLPSVSTAKGGMRRKHHRAWTLTEVVKLVDGVSKFGAGRWSEIKRLSFSSYAYRTSVDLKDKWRNLLKASFANPPSEKGMNPRKNAPSPIPAPILVKVRELAEINGQAPRSLKARSENSGSSVNENRAGYL